MLFRLLILSDLVKKVQCSTKIDKIENKIPNQDKYVTTPELNKLTKDNSTERLKQANLAIKNGIADFVKKKVDFDEKLRKIIYKVTSNETKHLEPDDITSSTKLINHLSEEVKLILTKELTKDLINGYDIIHFAKHFVKDG